MKALAAIAAIGLAAAAQAETVSFVTCPVYRDADAGRKSGCWVAEDPATGRRFDVSLAPSKPDWNHEVWVEGVVSSATPDACGAPVLDAVRTSILPGSCTRQMLPAEGFPGRRFVLPKRNVSPLSVVRAPPPGPYAARSFHIFYDFDQAFLIYQYGDYLLDEAIHWIRAAKPRRIVVTGWAATVPQKVSGRVLAETPSIAKLRAERIAEALVRLGVDRKTLEVRWKERSEPIDVPEADALADASRRRVDIEVSP